MIQTTLDQFLSKGIVTVRYDPKRRGQAADARRAKVIIQELGYTPVLKEEI